MATMRSFATAELADLVQRARANPRLRANLNVHSELEDRVQRMFNCFQPSTYVRPHQHEPARWELFVLLSGRLGVLTFGEKGQVTGRTVLSPGSGTAVEIPGGITHTVVSLAPDTTVFEVKPGPFRPLTDKDFGPWSPVEGDPHAAILLWEWERLFG
ncbi:MAG TPA: WbuC family cupin fold metalloprotein [Thermoanaerobaculaceae bacterium]|nr:WbuC family cupin fold metalloprotein [Thermoanaerobaculaceae bacterium]